MHLVAEKAEWGFVRCWVRFFVFFIILVNVIAVVNIRTFDVLVLYENILIEGK